MKLSSRTLTWLTLTAVFLVAAAQAQEMKPSPVGKGTASVLAPLKKLEGEWVGKAGPAGQQVDVTVTYHVTANGSAVMETLFPGTPHEMITMYVADGNRIALTHYCAMGNQPHMIARPGTAANQFVFDYVTSPGIDARKDAHMHGAKIQIVDDDHLRSEWTSFDKGKPAEVTSFELARKK